MSADFFKKIEELPLGWDIAADYENDREGAIRCCHQIRQKGRACCIECVFPPAPTQDVRFIVWEEPRLKSHENTHRTK